MYVLPEDCIGMGPEVARLENLVFGYTDIEPEIPDYSDDLYFEPDIPESVEWEEIEHEFENHYIYEQEDFGSDY